MTHDVFICHSSKDRTIANAICSTLEQHRIRCWIAPRDVIPGSDYAGSIIEAISSARLTVLVFSGNSNDSGHVRREIERTVGHGIPVLPFRVEEVVPSLALEYFISDAHWLDAMTPPLEQHLDHLVGTVKLLLEREAATAAVATEASAAGAAAASATAGSPPAAAPPSPIPSPMPPPIETSSPPVVGWAQPAASAGVSVGGAGTVRRRPPMAVLAAIGAVAIVVLAAGAFVLAGGGKPSPSQAAVLPSASPSPSPTVTSSPTPSADVTPTPAEPSAPAGSPDPALARITAVLPKSLTCDPAETPAPDSLEVASVFCYVGDGTIQYVDYTLYPSLSALRSGYGSWLSYYNLPMATTGSCEKGERMENTWSFTSTPSTTEGHYFCLVDDSKQANLFWTDEASRVLVDLTGEDGVTLDKLYPVWRGSSYDPIRP